MSTLTTSAIRRRTLVRPVRTAERTPVIQQKTKHVEANDALGCLNEFVKEARKEIRLRESVKMKLVKKDLCGSMSFLFDDFTLTINFKEGLAV